MALYEEPNLDGLVHAGDLALRLRLARPSDISGIVGHADSSVWLGVPLPCTTERAEFVLAEYSRGGWDGLFGFCRLVVDDRTDEIIAQISLMRSAAGSIEVSYGVAPTFRGRGIATAVLQFVTDRVLGGVLNRLEAVIDPRNAASVRVVTKAGYRYEGVRRQILDSGPVDVEDLVYVRTSPTIDPDATVS